MTELRPFNDDVMMMNVMSMKHGKEMKYNG